MVFEMYNMRIIKKLFLFLFLIGFGDVALAQNSRYVTKLDMHYYSDSINQIDEYMNERCVLDIYYPEGV